MRAITIREPGGPEVLEWTEVPDPEPGPGEVVVEVAASAVNRADLLQRQGFYPPPPGASEILGLECSGTIAAVGEGVEDWHYGDEVCALLAGGGYAEKVVVPAVQLLPVPGEVSLLTSAALPEVACTVWSNVVMIGQLTEGEVLLVHGGAGGIGTHAIQVGKALGATVAVTAGSAERLERCRQLGADITINYREQDFVEELKKETGGADVILDNMGASYLERNIAAVKPNGRITIIGFQGGTKAELNLTKLSAKRAFVSATTLRARPVEDKGRIVADVRKNLWPLVEDGSVQPIVGQAIPLSEAANGHRALEEGGVFGKVLLTSRA
ncbi:putative PIG3 family NAD(P)H quinone oxidoreductase [Amycolatopsis bartoniae]|uniref:NAD(P)H quinone oxidoreductase n=1 Tax=Amycolatopsis bartoniae TaxID=941986 RepID=A0A8H9MAR1_9PSEU|nr:NAD(P)H-quinone oxidoreductase [Amycolatopsis bartoniae]MBB2933424.1 putative PIG3 family NAD(P)H quinone oxidoreductase [Amycolatopsis bartoniae]TVT06611.1 NAD(P)H-quinone oxidoreductase [Amycolatopsis bartoniae]GHF59342.1 NAD(P)H quinone oxidoreductase [Amycolatopsis bartoniae]